SFSLLVKAIDYVGDLSALLDDPSVKITFFAPPDKALRRKHHHLLTEEDIYHGSHDLANLAYLIDAKTSLHKPDDEKRKRFIKAILRSILSYHIIPIGSLDIASLGLNTTFPTNLTIPGALASQPLRVRVQRSFLPARTTVNLYARITRSDVMATNGVIHVINHPLLPPPSIFQELFIAPQVFSTLTSAIQRMGLTDNIDLHYVRGLDGHKGHFQGASTVTVFAPTNRAFEVLPEKLRLFLFSPFGAPALKKLLQFHIVPDLVLHSVESALAEINIPRREPISSLKLALDTLLVNHTLHAQIDKFNITFPIPGPRQPGRVTTRFLVNRQRVLLPDIVGLNGAIHVVGRILDPRKHPHHGVAENEGEDVWGSWEQWLPQWGVHSEVSTVDLARFLLKSGTRCPQELLK
ncbi:uncharacterized protein LACBIDRAFT_232955, partial [Laccaria bicolor S238N-H82]